MKIGDKRDAKAVNHRHSHQVSKIVDYFGEAEDVEVMERSGGDEGDIKRHQGIAVVCESFVVERWNRQPFLFIPGEYPCNEKLEKEVARVDFPGVEVGVCILFYF